MSDTENEITLVGYWNGSRENPEIDFNIAEQKDKILSYITISPVPLPRQSDSVHGIKCSIQKANKISNDIKKLMESTKRLK